MTPNEEVHEEIMKAFDQYFRANQAWAVIQTRPTGIEARKCLQELKRVSLKLRQLCDHQRRIIQDWRHELYAPKQPGKRANHFIEQRKQKILNNEPVPEIKIGRRKRAK